MGRLSFLRTPRREGGGKRMQLPENIAQRMIRGQLIQQ